MLRSRRKKNSFLFRYRQLYFACLNMKEIVILSAILILLPLCASGTIYYADAKNGDDSNDGDGISSAFATIKPCIEALRSPGDECHIRSGRYHQSEFHISGKHGYADQPMIIRGYQNEIPIIDGTIPLEPGAGWELGEDGIYSGQIERDIWQLFVDGEMMTNARWPDSLWSDKTIFLNKYWGKSSKRSRRGKMVDNGEQNLAGSGLNVTGAMAILNIGSFNTFTAIVKSHTTGQGFFTYDDTFGNIDFKPFQNQYFLEDKLEFLNKAGEWFYDKNTKTVYVKTLDGNSPEGRIRGKVSKHNHSFEFISVLSVRWPHGYCAPPRSGPGSSPRLGHCFVFLGVFHHPVI